MGEAAHGTGLILAGNALLASLAHDDLRLIVPYLQRSNRRRGETLFHADQELDRVYFPETAVVAILEPRDHGTAVELGLVGREGFLGWSVALGCSRATSTAIVQLDGGTLLSIESDALRSACRASATFMTTLLRFVETITVQMGCSLIARRFALSSRLARWLLMRHDRLPHDTLRVHHDEIAGHLGVRRASVTDCLHCLEGDALVRSRRGKIIITNRLGLEALAGETYGRAEEHHRDVLGALGRPVEKDGFRRDIYSTSNNERVYTAAFGPSVIAPCEPKSVPIASMHRDRTMVNALG